MAPTNRYVNRDAYKLNRDEYQTPPRYLELVREVLGGIDFDPCSTAEANKLVRAESYVTKEMDCLAMPFWVGPRRWLNPPYSSPSCGLIVDRWWRELQPEPFKQGAKSPNTAGILLVNSATETGYYQLSLRHAAAICWPDHRISFWHADRPSKKGAPDMDAVPNEHGLYEHKGNIAGQSFFYGGPSWLATRFAELFGQIGTVVVR